MSTVLEILRSVSDAISAAVPEPSIGESALLDALRRQIDRLAEGRFQLAVVGHAKRGKSTLVNALVGEELLIADVLPATAISTFVTDGVECGVALVHDGGRTERIVSAGVRELRELVAAAATEKGNPVNRLRLDRVEVTLPGTGLPKTLTLVDTPGVGSAHGHNTRTAHAALPECDAALFVVAIDPPITEVELSFLDTVCASASEVLVALNKVDTIAGTEAGRIAGYVRDQVGRRLGHRPAPAVFPISARTALAARRSGDAEALAASGLPELEDAVRIGLVGHKQALLAASVHTKVRVIAAELLATAELHVQALGLPLEDLDRRIGELDRCAARFDLELRALRDGFEGDRRRALGRLDEICAALGRRVAAEASLASAAPDLAGTQSGMSEMFDRELGTAAGEIGAMVDDVVASCRVRYGKVVDATRLAAGAIADVAMPEVPSTGFEILRRPYWSGRVELDDVASLTLDNVYRVLPRGLRRRREQRRQREAVERAVSRNVSDLNWSARQSIDDTFRRLLAQASRAATTGPDAVQGVLLAVRRARREKGAELDRDLAEARRRTAALAAALARLDLVGPASASDGGRLHAARAHPQ